MIYIVYGGKNIQPILEVFSTKEQAEIFIEEVCMNFLEKVFPEWDNEKKKKNVKEIKSFYKIKETVLND